MGCTRPAAPTRSLGSRSRTWIRSRRRSRRSRRPRGLRSRSNASSVGDSVPDARSPDPVASWERAPEARRVRGGLCSEVMSGPSLRGMGAALDPAATVLRVSAHHMPSAGKCSETFPECWPGHLCLGARTPEPLRVAFVSVDLVWPNSPGKFGDASRGGGLAASPSTTRPC